MTRISQDFINTVGCLYEEINLQSQDFLNEESDYYDEEASEMVDDILSTISTMMVYEGYSAEGIIGFLADSSEDLILEKYLSFDENILNESNVSEEYIVEQLIIFDAAINEGIVSGLGKLAKGAVGLVGRIASKPARSRVSKILSTAKNPEEARKMLQRVAQDSARKSNVGGYSSKMSPVGGGKLTGKQSAELLTKGKIGQAVQKVKDIASKAKAVLTGPTAKKLGLGALVAGLPVAGGFVGAKLAGAGGGLQNGLKAQPPKDDFLKGSTLAKLGGREGRIKGGEFRTMKWSPESRSRYAASTAKPPAIAPSPAPSSTPSGGGGGGAGSPSGAGSGGSASRRNASQPSGQTGDKARDMETWARANPEAASRVKPGQAGYDVISRLRDKPGPSEKQDQTPTQGSPTAQIDPASVQKAIDAENERLKKKLEQKNQSTSTPTNESYEPYDIILEYLITKGHADSIDEANYIMLEMDETAVQTIIENYNDVLLAEEVSEWVNVLIDEGYDLSDYTWDEIVEYYVTEANREEREKGMNQTQRTERRNVGWENPKNRPSYNRVGYQRNRTNDPTPRLGDPSTLSGRIPGNRNYNKTNQVFATELPSGRTIIGRTNQYANPRLRGSSTLSNVGRGVESSPSGLRFRPGTGGNFGISGIGLAN